MLRITAYGGLLFVTFVIYLHNPSTIMIVLLLIATIIMIGIEYYINEDLVPDEARQYLQQ